MSGARVHVLSDVEPISASQLEDMIDCGGYSARISFGCAGNGACGATSEFSRMLDCTLPDVF